MDGKTKKLITQEWLNAFPDLNAYAQNKLYKIIGPFVLGIELINLPRSETYRPHFVIYPLWKSNVKSCLDYPAFMEEFHDSKRLQLDLPYKDTNEKYKEAQVIVSNSLRISFTGNVTLERLFAFIDDVLQNEVRLQSHSGIVASVFEWKFYAALYAGSTIQVEKVLNQIQRESNSWDMKMFEVWYGKFDVWLKGLQGKVISREDFLKQIETNKQDKKISKLKWSELTA